MNRRTYEKGMRETKEAALAFEEQKAMVVRICHAVSGTCVMALKSPHHDDCDIKNCSAWRAAFAHTSKGDA